MFISPSFSVNHDNNSHYSLMNIFGEMKNVNAKTLTKNKKIIFGHLFLLSFMYTFMWFFWLSSGRENIVPIFRSVVHMLTLVVSRPANCRIFGE